MESYFKISQVSAVGDRIPVSFRVREYFEEFSKENILIPKKLIIDSKWNVLLGIIFMSEGKRGPKGIFMAKGGPRSVSENKVKLYEIIIPIRPIQESERPLLKTIQMIYESLKLFFTRTYKKVTPEFMDELWSKVDLGYLLSLPYPAPLNEQKYVGDKEHPDGTVTVIE